MKKFFLLIFTALTLHAEGQQEDAKSPQETAKSFIKQGDYSNAIMVLNKALLLDPGNLEMRKDLAFSQYLQKNYNKAVLTVEELLDRRDADVQVYQLAGMIYKGMEDAKEAEKLYKRGLRKFPASGVLFNEYGELLWYKQDYNAILQWEKGIEADPNYSANYYNAAKYYFFTMDKVWSVIYAEIFVN
ncbi:MAG: tetratricopeptide repeat protein, partial [Chitinophagaceae bacterium]